MMLNEAMQEAINEQINNELFSMYSYLSMSAYCEHKQFRGCAHWMRLQSQEEYGHAMRLYDFLIARQGRVKLQPIAQPQIRFRVGAGRVPEGARAGANRHRADQLALRNGVQAKRRSPRWSSSNGSSTSRSRKKRRPATSSTSSSS